MDEDYPFGEAYGPASSREVAVQSAAEVFQRLLCLTPGTVTLKFQVLQMLAQDDAEGIKLNRGKLKIIKRMFRPDADGELGEIDFIRACDILYKKLRFFRASVGNASVIDHVLESTVDAMFNFILLLVLMSVTGFNPWPLLVSLSTLLVSISFAVGSSASKYIEGILLIAVRRPYDLGDRMYMTDPSQVNNDFNFFTTWFVEDINLFNTTVRYAGTNEVATINNGAIANMRIINMSRSPNAMVWFVMPFKTCILQDGRLEKLRMWLDLYAKDNPRQWHSFVYCRVDELQSHIDKLLITIGLQHRSNWVSEIQTAGGRISYTSARCIDKTAKSNFYLPVHINHARTGRPQRDLDSQGGSHVQHLGIR